MKSFINKIIFLGWILSAQATVNTQGFPPELGGYIEINAEKFWETKIGKSVRAATNENPELKSFTQKTGIQTSDIKKINIGFYPDPTGKINPSNLLGVILLRGNFKQEALEVCAKSNGVKPRNSGKCQIWDLKKILAIFTDRAQELTEDSGAVITGQPNTIAMVTTKALTEKTVNSLGILGNNTKPPGSLGSSINTPSDAWLFVGLDGDKIEEAEGSGLKGLNFTASETGSEVQFKLWLGFSNKEQARDASSKMKTFKLMTTMALGNKDEDQTPDQENMRKFLSKLVENAKIEISGNAVTVGLNCPATEAATLIKTFIEKGQATDDASFLKTPLLR